MITSVVRQLAKSKIIGIGSILVLYILLITTARHLPPPQIIFSNLFIIASSTALIYSKKNESVSIIKIFGVFYLIFFGITPLIEAINNVSYWNGTRLSYYNYTIVNAMLIIGLLLFIATYKIGRSHIHTKQQNNRNNRNKIKKYFTSNYRYLILPFATCCITIVWMKNFNIYEIIYRGGDFFEMQAINRKTLNLITENYLRPFSFSCAILCIHAYKFKRNIQIFWPIIFSLIAIALNLPTAIPRFAIAALYIPMFILIYPKILKSSYLPINIFILSFVTVFPFFNAFRYIDNSFSSKNIEFGLSYTFFTSGHFDAYQNLSRTIALDIITYGNQLLGSLFFFVPRKIWESKPLGSGELLSKEANLSFSNIAQSLPAEGYINFGFTGLCAFMMIFGYTAGRLDKKYWSNEETSITTTYSLYYYQIVGLTIFIMRGDLMNAIAYTTGFMLSMKTASLFFNHRPYTIRQHQQPKTK